MSSDRCRELNEALRGSTKELPALVQWVKGLTDVEDCIASGLRRSSENEEWLAFEHYVLAAFHHPSRSYTEALCRVLHLQSDDVTNENIVDALAESRDPAAIDCLKKALAWEPAWDEFRNLAVKCIWALAAIGTPEAVALIRDAASSPAFKVREAALSELRRIGG